MKLAVKLGQSRGEGYPEVILRSVYAKDLSIREVLGYLVILVRIDIRYFEVKALTNIRLR